MTDTFWSFFLALRTRRASTCITVSVTGSSWTACLPRGDTPAVEPPRRTLFFLPIGTTATTTAMTEARERSDTKLAVSKTKINSPNT